MTQKAATLWKGNPTKNADAVAYSASATAYNSSTTSYSSSTVGSAESGKLPDSWSKTTKNATLFVPNPAATTSQYLYDSALKTYDSATDSYDGVVSGQDLSDQKLPSVWNKL